MKTIICTSVSVLFFIACALAQSTDKYNVVTVTLPASVSTTDYDSTGTVLVTITGDSAEAQTKSFSIVVSAYWDGSTTWKFRFAPPYEGRYSYDVSSGDGNLNGASGTIRCLSDLGKQGRLSVFKSYFLKTERGNTFLLLGDTQWRGFADNDSNGDEVDDTEWDQIITARTSQRFNAIQWISGRSSDATRTLDGEVPFTSQDIDDLNPLFWQALDSRVQDIFDGGMIIVWSSQFAADDNAFDTYTTTQLNRWFQYLIDRYGAYPVIWSGMGEYDAGTGDGDTQWHAMFDYYDDNDPWNNPITAHPSGSSDDGPMSNEEGHIDIHGMQYHTTPSNLFDGVATARTKGLPGFYMEWGYADGSGGNDQTDIEVLEDAWAMMMGGVMGMTYGNRSVWQGTDVDSVDDVSASYMDHLHKFWNDEVRWWEFDTWDGIGTFPYDEYHSHKDGLQHVVWVETDGGSFNVDLSDMTAPIFGKWYDATTGEFVSSVSLGTTASESLDAPGNHHACLIENREYKPAVVTVGN